ncbi:hypothetical protein [Chryseobacterium oncorhynchi]|uniref:hypothetical protein n=1 Tax=Chryseobacterium oncorhynchi TaxID=741074 RepID=UPI001403087D|nr:hypothetical protein [Chryseobacterium oncorhynchi]
MELKIGDTVYLKSDARTIITINDLGLRGPEYYECIWFAQEILQIGEFHRDTLIKYDRE